MTMEPISEDAFSAALQEEQREQQRQQPRVGKASPKPSHAYVKAKMETTTTDRMEKKNGDGDDSADMEEEEEEYLPFHILPHIRERSQCCRGFTPWKLLGKVQRLRRFGNVFRGVRVAEVCVTSGG